ncbi:MAG: phosphatidate cytidylyltransferase [Clostridia bacterium]|nr:phosphatidate cytidylyltransferase [Clostridia bacterium]
MKTRIISGVVAAAAVALLLLLNSFFSIVAVVAVALLAALAVYEILVGTGAVKKGAPVYIAMFYAAALQFSYSGIFINSNSLSVLFVLSIAIIAVLNHKNFTVNELAFTIAMPIIISFAFACLEQIINPGDKTGLLYFLLLFNFACVTDIGAYFVGSAIGKHKLAPEISPKKTVEGAVGGIVCSVIGTLIISIVFSLILKTSVNVILLTLVTPVFSVIGMFGDLFASVIKRHFGIKDYGNIMPGHGGVLDRTDSILLIAPAFVFFLNLVGGIV